MSSPYLDFSHIDGNTRKVLQALIDHRALRSQLRNNRPRDSNAAATRLAGESVANLAEFEDVCMLRPRKRPILDHGLRAVMLFAEAASRQSPDLVELLVDFLRRPSPSTALLQGLHDTVRSKLDRFVEAEVAMSGESRDRLTLPSGREDAQFGIVLHCQSQKENVAGFWNENNRTIQLLMDKGLKGGDIFGFDWHWRAEETARVGKGKSGCLASKWPRPVRALHDNLSAEILDTLPLPWIMVGGSCAQKSYRKTLTADALDLTLQLHPLENGAKFVLDIGNRRIRRIAIFIPHPSAGFYNPTMAAANGAILDATFNFLLWLHDIPFLSSSFMDTMSKIKRGIPGAAPLPQLWDYKKLESSLGRCLSQDEYEPAFFAWAATYLSHNTQRRAIDVLQSGESLAHAVSAVLRTKEAKRFEQRAELDGYNKLSRVGNAHIYGYEYKQYWDGEPVRITQKGSFSIFTDISLEPLRSFGGRRLYRTWKEHSNDPAVIRFLDGMILLVQRGEIIFKKKIMAVDGQAQSARWTRQISIELANRALLGGVIDQALKRAALLAQETLTRSSRQMNIRSS